MPLSSPAGRHRVDRLLVARGIAATRAQAQAAIAAGLVTADGVVVTKPSTAVADTAILTAEAPHPWVSRGGVKLAHALDVFAIDPSGRDCLDLGASTGGFTDVLVTRGARSVTAVDVGTKQLHAKLAADARVTSLERTDARDLVPAMFAAPPSLLVADLAFISLAKAIGRALACLLRPADVVLLVKPQFEVGPAKIGKRGIVDPAVAEDAAARVGAELSARFGFRIIAIIESPIVGGDGNREFLLHARFGEPERQAP